MVRILAALVCGMALSACTAVSGPGPRSESAGGLGPGASSPLPDAPETRRFEIAVAGKTLPIWYLRPSGASADAPIIFVMHGVGRDADRYLREWAPIARAQNFVLVVPEFTREGFPGAEGYNLGATMGADGKPSPRDQWSYGGIEVAFDAIRARETLSAKTYLLYGHSAGGQFVHRYVMLGMGKRMSRAVAANSGWYTFANDRTTWPYGLSGGPQALGADKMFAAPLYLVLGDQDIDPNHRSLAREPEAMAQGAYRFARGQAFYADARSTAATLNVPMKWGCYTAPGLAHDNALAARYSAPLLLGEALPVGRDCAPLPSLVGR
jgi:poly(3-hydroxybutyrate) depolymerase